jgi:large subunit ribosomal protein L15
MIKTHKTKKSKKQRGKGMGTYGRGARKAGKDSGHRGGIGMAGSGKRADHKKTLITKIYGNNYFGKQGITSKSTKRKKREDISLREIQDKKEKLGKKTSKGWEFNLENKKILGNGEAKDKFIITAKAASKSAIEKVEAAGGKIILPKKKEELKEKIEEKSEKPEKEKAGDKKSKENSKKEKTLKKKASEGKEKQKSEKSEKKKKE